MEGKTQGKGQGASYQGNIWEGVHIALDGLARFLQVQSVLEMEEETT